MMYRVLAYDGNAERQVHKRATLARFSSCCALFALIGLVLASALPLWVVTTFKGSGTLLVADFDVNLGIGDGIWLRNVCYGSRSTEDVLNRAGLSCDGRMQTEGCLDDDLSQAQVDHCNIFFSAQTVESGAVFFALVAWLLGVCMPRAGVRFGPAIASMITAASAMSVMAVLSDSYMFKHRDQFACASVFGAELCHGYGGALHLQSLAIVCCMARVMCEVVLACTPAPESLATGGEIFVHTVPLLRGELVPVAQAVPVYATSSSSSNTLV